MKKGLNRDHQQQLQHHSNINLQTSSFPSSFNTSDNQSNNLQHQPPRHHLYNNPVPQVQSQFTSLALNNYNHQSQGYNRPIQHSRNTSSPRPNNVVVRPSVQHSQSQQPQAARWVPHSIKNVQPKTLSAEDHNQAIFRKVRG